MLTILDPFKSLADLLGEFHEAHSYGDELSLWCSACHSLPDDPVLTSCLHLYCLECFTEILVEAKADASRPVCEALGCEGFIIPNGFHQLSPAQFQVLAQSIGVTVRDPVLDSARHGVNGVPQPSPFDMFWNAQGTIHAISNTDDIEALSTVMQPPTPQNPALIGTSDRARMSASDKVVESAVKAHREQLLDGLHDSDDDWDLHDGSISYESQSSDARSKGYATSDQEDSDSDNDSISDGPAEHPFINDGPMPKPAKYILDSDSDSATSTDSDSDAGEYDSDVSDVSSTEVRVLRNDWPKEWRLTNPPALYTVIVGGPGPNFRGWWCKERNSR